MLDRYGFIYHQYEAKWWYWECIELGRKLCLTSIIIFLWPGSAMQLAVGQLLALFFIVLVSALRWQSFSDVTVLSPTLTYVLALAANDHLSHYPPQYSRCGPYETNADDQLQLVCQITIFLCYFSGVLLKLEVSEAEGDGFANFMVLIVVLPIVFAAFVMVFYAIIPLLVAVITERKLLMGLVMDEDGAIEEERIEEESKEREGDGTNKDENDSGEQEPEDMRSFNKAMRETSAIKRRAATKTVV
jgi:hypothetical protein